MSEASFRSRMPADDDPLVCPACGRTVGTRALEKPGNEERLARVREEHQPLCLRRQEHMRKHRRQDGPCQPDGCPDTLASF